MAKNLGAPAHPVVSAVPNLPSQDGETLLSEPTGLATVGVFATPEGAGVSVSVPGGSSDHMLRTLKCVSATAASTVGSVASLKFTSGTELPWEASVGLALLLAVMPLVYFLLSSRRSRRE
ncbi:hypothetical protein ACFW3D_12390 [Streptomyces sp. NPDC058864]